MKYRCIGHTPYTKKQIVEHVVASLTNSIMFGTNYNFVISQNGPIPFEHVGQGLHMHCFKQGMTHSHPFVHTHNKELPYI
jgi:hypothetical protein